MIEPLKIAAERIGGVASLAERLGVSPQAIYQWKEVPIERASAIERLTGVSKAVLRPDVFTSEGSGSSATYESDYYLWLSEQIAALQERSFAGLDAENLAEELRDMGRSLRDSIESRLKILLLHLLKWEFQPANRTNSWRASVVEQRMRIAGILDESPSLKSYPGKVLDKAYRIAVLEASGETGLPVHQLPTSCPYAIEDALSEGFWPGPSQPMPD
jgi:DNA-binding transcriptional regulator YdaS (Cro superfamily)